MVQTDETCRSNSAKRDSEESSRWRRFPIVAHSKHLCPLDHLSFVRSLPLSKPLSLSVQKSRTFAA